ncbi:MAG TPA: hypothetical protein VG796_25490 [Verrucomicrobiales bacterium]|nr:hypothetical protein [Verrucomicrobiales bacterium]
MRTSSHLCKKPAGGVLVLALIAIGFVAVGFSTWISMLGQRGRAAEIEEHATRRRIAAYNSRAAIQEYTLQRMITSSGDANGVSFDPLGGALDVDPGDERPLKGMTVTSAPAWTGYPLASSTRLAGLNGFSPTWDYPYSKQLDVTAATKALGFNKVMIGTEGDFRLEENFTNTASYLRTYIRSRSLVLGGDLLVIHRSKLSTPADPIVTGNVSVDGRVMHFRPDLAEASYTARSARFISSPGTMNVRPKNLSGANLAPTNLAWVPLTSGAINGATDFSGKLNVIEDAANGGNSLVQSLTASAATLQNTSGATPMTDPRGYSNPGAGVVTVTPSIGVTNPADLPSVIIKNEVSEIIIEGQDPTNFATYARYRPAMAIVYIQDTTSVRKLTTIRLRNQGGRRMLLAIKQNGDVAGGAVNVILEDTNAISEWNMIILAENTPLTFSLGTPGTLNLMGGIQTDAALTGPGTGKTLAIQLQTDTRGLIKMAPRAGWVETIMPDKIPASTADNTW